jgi:small-conductance mechanosensitive channel
VITAQTPAPAPTDGPGPAAEHAALASAIDAQARRMDQLSAAIVRATSQVTWSGRAAERFRARAAERSRECLQLAVALRASAERVHAAETARPAAHPGRPGSAEGGGHADIADALSGAGGDPVAAVAGAAGGGGPGRAR